ncbi:MAG: hypothetical protein R3195_15230 [Gemmatimonadota bacterium]|nr:hypothetical protein [Gemmatimonadota bacterium]
MRTWRWALGFGLVAIGVAGGVRSLTSVDVFDHGAHAGLFVGCASCHAVGTPAGETAPTTVTAVACGRCHDGTREETVDWTEPARRPTNLAFSHVEHGGLVASAGDDPIACAGCHSTGGGRLMDVGPAQPETCIGCHAHESAAHLEATECVACHVPLASATGLTTGRIAEFGRPSDHDAPDFASSHGDGASEASCAVCHVRQSCARCHLDADRQPAVLSLAADSRVAPLLADLEGEWPEPASHAEPGFADRHGADGVATCGTCHAASSCEGCHRRGARAWLAEMPRPGPDEPRGVVVTASGPASHTARFAIEHATAVGAGAASCESCHAPAECSNCHTGATAGLSAAAPAVALEPSPHRDPRGGERESGYHIANFVQRHGAEAFGVQTTCTDCHSTEAFCRDCHTRSGVGVGSNESAGGAYHDTRTSWLIGHGASARMGLEACASCHQQTSCLRCHSAKAGWGVNPHGSGWDPARVSERSLLSCAVCHTSDQIPPP